MYWKRHRSRWRNRKRQTNKKTHRIVRFDEVVNITQNWCTTDDSCSTCIALVCRVGTANERQHRRNPGNQPPTSLPQLQPSPAPQVSLHISQEKGREHWRDARGRTNWSLFGANLGLLWRAAGCGSGLRGWMAACGLCRRTGPPVGLVG